MPRKVFSFLLLFVLLFTWFGYRVLIDVLQDRADARLEMQLDEDNYDSTQLISIKVPVRYLPYYYNSESFNRVDGEIEIQGIPYKYVKSRILNDSIELLCIPNAAAIDLQSASNEFFRFSTDMKPAKKSGSRSGVLKIFSVDYLDTGENKGFRPTASAQDLFYLHYSTKIPIRDICVAEHPPDC